MAIKKVTRVKKLKNIAPSIIKKNASGIKIIELKILVNNSLFIKFFQNFF